jgi:hypothetical protein
MANSKAAQPLSGGGDGLVVAANRDTNWLVPTFRCFKVTADWDFLILVLCLTHASYIFA